MALEDFSPVWAQGGATTEPTIQQKNTGFVAGAADPAIVNWLFQEQQERFNLLRQLVDSRVIFDDMVVNVPGDFSDIQSAIAFLNDKIISPPAVVTIRVAAGVYTIDRALYIDHPNGNRIEIIGDSTTKVWPDETSFTTNQATDELVLRDLFPTQIRCIGCAGLSMQSHSLGRLQNILFLGDGSPFNGMLIGNRDGQLGRASVFVDTVWCHRFGQHGVRADFVSTITGDRLGVSHSALQGIANARSTVRVSNVRSLRGASAGILTQNNADTVIDDAIVANNGGPGINTNFNSQTRGQRVKFRSNTTYHSQADVAASVELTQPNADAIGTAYYASNASFQRILQAVGTATVSPANGAVGNNAALTVVG